MVSRVPKEERKMKTKKASAVKKVKKPVQRTQVRSKAARGNIAEGTRLFALAGRPTKAQFVKVYGPQGPKMTWAQRAKAGEYQSEAATIRVSFGKAARHTRL